MIDEPNTSTLKSAARVVIVLAGLTLLTTAFPSGTVDAHANLDPMRSNPTPDSVNEVPPEKIRLWFTEPLDPSQSTIRVFDESGTRVDADDAEVDAGDPHQMTVSMDSLDDGTYSVSWYALSTVDGHPSQGTFTYRVGQSRLPGGAATTEGERPPIESVTLRWLTIGGLTLVAGWFLLAFLGVDIAVTNRGLALAGALGALLGDVGKVPQQVFSTAETSAGFGEVLMSMPDGWYVRLVTEVALIAVVVIIAKRKTAPLRNLIGTGLAAVAVLTLTFTSHSAADEYRYIAMISNALHLESVAFWLGSLAHLAVIAVLGTAPSRDALRRFSKLALFLAPIAILTGFINAGLLLPSVESAWSSGYGRSLLLKLLFVAGVLAFAWLNRARLRAGLSYVRAISGSLRAEAALGVTAIMIASFMSLSALPTLEEDHPLRLATHVGETEIAHFEMDEPDTGDNDVRLWLANDEGMPVQDLDNVTVEFEMLEQNENLERRAEEQQDGRWLISDLGAETEGWWRATAEFTHAADTSTAEFIFLLPDPTFVGADFDRTTDPEVSELYSTALSQLLALDSMRAVENLSDGVGNAVSTQYQYQAPDRLRYLTSSGNESIAVGGDQYLLKDGEDAWQKRERTRPYSFPDVFSFFYSGARNLSLGKQVTVDGEQYQLISFYVPEVTGRTEAWYLWWIDTDTGMVHREAMIANHHYMINEFGSFNESMEIKAPDIEAKSDAVSRALDPDSTAHQ